LLPPPISPSPTTVVPAGADASCIPKGSKVEIGEVLSITDGDTINVSLNGESYSVRLIGMDSPEGGAPFATEATDLTAELLLGKTVYFVVDVSETDRYDRLLRYVLVDNTFVNLRLVQAGLAWARDYPPDTSCSSAFHEAEKHARAEGLGFWATAPTPAGDTASICDSSYPTVCIPPPPPDLDCGDIAHRRFAVQPPDPHRFDGNHDGVGCEG
jgi:micrococcal nuclease